MFSNKKNKLLKIINNYNRLLSDMDKAGYGPATKDYSKVLRQKLLNQQSLLMLDYNELKERVQDSYISQKMADRIKEIDKISVEIQKLESKLQIRKSVSGATFQKGPMGGF